MGDPHHRRSEPGGGLLDRHVYHGGKSVDRCSLGGSEGRRAGGCGNRGTHNGDAAGGYGGVFIPVGWAVNPYSAFFDVLVTWMDRDKISLGVWREAWGSCVMLGAVLPPSFWTPVIGFWLLAAAERKGFFG